MLSSSSSCSSSLVKNALTHHGRKISTAAAAAAAASPFLRGVVDQSTCRRRYTATSSSSRSSNSSSFTGLGPTPHTKMFMFYSSASSSAVSALASKRPRLQALRQRLASEEGEGDEDELPVEALSTTTTTTSQSHRHVNSKCSSTSTTTTTITSWASKSSSTSPSTVTSPSTSSSAPRSQAIPSSSTSSSKVSSSSSSSSSPSSSSSSSPSSLNDLILRLRDLPMPNRHVLQDRFHRQHSYLRISLVERCNLRCTYCMPADGLPQLQPTSSLLQTPELLYLASIFGELGVRKIRLTGGEPLLRHDLVDVLQGLTDTSIPLSLDQLGMTTNGITLARQLPTLVDAGLTHVNLSLDTLDPKKFERITRRKGWDKVWQSLQAACDLYRGHDSEIDKYDYAETTTTTTLPTNNNQVTPTNDTATPIQPLQQQQQRRKGLGRIKLNCVVQRGVNDDEMADFAQLTLQYPMLDVRFIEWMPFSDNGWQNNHLVPYQEMKQRLMESSLSSSSSSSSSSNNNYQLQRLRDGPNDTTKWYQWMEAEEQPQQQGGSSGTMVDATPHARLPDRGRIGFISSMTHNFCATCNRLRLTADGQFKVCLFGTHEVSLRDAIRQDVPKDDLQRIIAHAVWNKHWALGGHDSATQLQEHAHDNRPMVLIGG